MASTATNASGEFVVGASARAIIAATPETLWPWISDPTRHPLLAGSGEPQSISVIGGHMADVGVGTRFEAQQAILGVVRYVSHSEVLNVEPNRRFHFRVEERADWDFLLEPADGGTRVTHRHRFRVPTAGMMGLITPLQRLRARQNAGNMVRTLNNLARLVGAPPPTSMQVNYEPPTLD